MATVETVQAAEAAWSEASDAAEREQTDDNCAVEDAAWKAYLAACAEAGICELIGCLEPRREGSFYCNGAH